MTLHLTDLLYWCLISVGKSLSIQQNFPEVNLHLKFFLKDTHIRYYVILFIVVLLASPVVFCLFVFLPFHGYAKSAHGYIYTHQLLHVTCLVLLMWYVFIHFAIDYCLRFCLVFSFFWTSHNKSLHLGFSTKSWHPVKWFAAFHYFLLAIYNLNVYLNDTHLLYFFCHFFINTSNLSGFFFLLFKWPTHYIFRKSHY